MAVRLVRPATAFGDTARATKRPRVKEGSHLAFIRELPCLACGRPGPSEAAHIRMGDPRFAKRPTGGGEKPSDRWVTPLCSECHRTGPDAQHSRNERDWWASRGIDAVVVAAALHAETGDHEAAAVILRHKGDA